MKQSHFYSFCMKPLIYALCLMSPLVWGGEMQNRVTDTAESNSFWGSLLDQSYVDPAKKVHLYKDDTNPYIQEVNLCFRAQYQMAAMTANQGTYEGSDGFTDGWRRFRLGGNMTVFKKFKIANVWNVGGVPVTGQYRNGAWDHHRLASGNLYEAYVEYNGESDFKLSVGKSLPLFMAENRKSSAKYDLPEMSVLETALAMGSSFGVWAQQETSERSWNWNLGLWSNTEKPRRGEWGTWDGVNLMGRVSRKVDDLLLKEGRLHLDWVHNFTPSDEMSLKSREDKYVGSNAEDIFAFYYVGKEGPWELSMEAIYGLKPASYKQSGKVVSPEDVYGITIMPMYMISPHVQGVVRYQWAAGDQGVKLPGNYTTTLVPTGGSYVDRYQALALGFNFFIYSAVPDRLRVSTMVEYGNSHRKQGTGGFTGWTFLAGVYTNF